ncbi:hypothetical protein CAPTEDRAFT_218869 [Capitella teleta]|uniref:LRRCT domain-containing protein n=1 Tax=Capitella teleta TaxID=283909 RepID=R7TI81_CAPTE|nr:hypothetical protein CAPTEDRAFT_218869 [Capitella teleta]|eukprot:ELT90785.1 hypothetical protein CAPTEDRAFT_218869 [Capitella teleta]
MEIRRLLWLLVCLANFEERLCAKFVDLSNRGLTSVPEDIASNVTHLYLNVNDITRIRQSDFNDKYPDLAQLHIKWNYITSIESGCFKGPSLKWLFLDSNKLTSIPDLHEVSISLIGLYLDSNEITTITFDELSYLTKLTGLCLSGNRLTTLPDIAQFMPSLNILWLNKNPLDCCCSNVWLKQRRTGLGLGLSDFPCKHPSGWKSTTWDDITEDMILRQPCQASFPTPRLCGEYSTIDEIMLKLSPYNVYERTAATMWETYSNRLAFSQWQLFTWVAVYGLQVFWILYGLELCCRKSRSGTLYSDVPILPPSVYVFFSLAVAATFACHVMWTSYTLHDYAPLLMLLSCVCSYVSVFIAGSSLNRHKIALYADVKYVWESQWLVHNALGAFATMATIVLLHQVISQVDALYKLGDAGPLYLFMGLLLLHLIVWLLIDVLASKQIFPFMFTPFLLCIASFVQVVLIHMSQVNDVFLMSAVFLGFSCFLTVVKMWNACGVGCHKSHA